MREKNRVIVAAVGGLSFVLMCLFPSNPIFSANFLCCIIYVAFDWGDFNF